MPTVAGNVEDPYHLVSGCSCVICIRPAPTRALLIWGDRRVRFEYDFDDGVDPATGRKFNWYFFLREGVGEHANVSTWPWDAGKVADEDREQAWLLAMEAILVRHTRLIDNHPAWLGVARFRSGGREFTLEDFGYDAAMVEEANKR